MVFRSRGKNSAEGVTYWLSLDWLLYGRTLLGPPDSVVDVGSTEVTEEIFLEYLSSLGESLFR